MFLLFCTRSEKLHLTAAIHHFSQEFSPQILSLLTARRMNYCLTTAPPQTFQISFPFPCAAYFAFTNPCPPLWRTQMLNPMTNLYFELSDSLVSVTSVKHHTCDFSSAIVNHSPAKPTDLLHTQRLFCRSHIIWSKSFISHVLLNVWNQLSLNKKQKAADVGGTY